MKEFIEKLIERLEEHCGIKSEVCDCNGVCSECDFRASIEIVNELAKEYNNGWIPCSERLPNKEEYLKNDGRFIVTDRNRVYQSVYDIYQGKFRTLKLLISGWVFADDNCVIAWQPLPDPYIENERKGE